MLTWLAVGIGGGLGAMARHGVNSLVAAYWPTVRFPLSTTLINITGCIVFGAVAGFLSSGRASLHLQWREFLFVGVLGGFTTFSALSFETVTLLREREIGYALLNVTLQIVAGTIGLYAAFVGVEQMTR